MDSHTEETLKQALNEYENMRDKTERTYYQNCLVAMGDEVQRLRAKLNTIAFPRRGSPEAGWGVDEIGRFAADEQANTPEVDTDSNIPQVSPAAQRDAFVAASEYFAKLMGLPPAIWRTFAEAEARRRYPDTAGEASRDEEESSKRADDLANAFVGGTHFMATHPDCTTDQVFAEANRRYSARL